MRLFGLSKARQRTLDLLEQHLKEEVENDREDDASTQSAGYGIERLLGHPARTREDVDFYSSGNHQDEYPKPGQGTFGAPGRY